MLFDLDLIRTVYGTFANRVDAARKAAGTPLTLTEKILYAHLFDADGTKLPIGTPTSAARTTSISVPTAWRCRTRRRRWRCCNS